VYAGTTLLGTATTTGTDWVLTTGKFLTAGTHTLKAVVYNAYSMIEGANTNSWPITTVMNPNLLLGSTVTDSCSLQNCPADTYGLSNTLTDGDIETARNLSTYSGSFNIFLADAKSISSLRLLPSMLPNGIIDIEVQTSTDPNGATGTWISHGVNSREMADKTWFNINLTSNTNNIRAVKIIFHSSPSWVALYEVEGY
jgi:hypothetical protein